MAKCDVLQKILNEVEMGKQTVYIDDAFTIFSHIKELCTQAIAEKVELKGKRASDNIPTAYLQHNGDEFVVHSPSNNPDETYFIDDLIDAVNTYFFMRGVNCFDIEKVVITMIE